MNQDDYGDGYAAGKAKGLFEAAIAACHMSTTPECRCPHAWAYGTPSTP